MLNNLVEMGERYMNVGAETKEKSSLLEFLAAFVVIPVVLIVMQSLPSSLRSSMVLQINSPTAWQMFWSNYIHAGTGHLVSNITGYVISMVILYPLAVIGERKRELLYFSIFSLLIVPFLVSAYTVGVLDVTSVENSVGFSGIGSAFLGFIPIMTFFFLNSKVSSNFAIGSAVALAGVEFGVVFIAIGWNPGIMLILILLGIVSLASQFREISESDDWDKSAFNQYMDLILLAILSFIVYPFPLLVFVEKGTNIFAHLIGFVSGFLAPFLFYLVTEQIDALSVKVRQTGQ